MNQQGNENLTKGLGFERLGIHYIRLEPGQRSSIPHAESHEEEFVYVVRGEPDVWLDGLSYRLKPGHACGFKAGTGMAHTFLNNSQDLVELLVVGERTKPENRCAYPVDPLEHQKSKIRWDDCPKRSLGPHSGKPGPEPVSDPTSLPSCVVHAPSIPLKEYPHYPGDNERMSVGPRLTNLLGLEKLGISLDVLMPGRRSSFPHAHTMEEEFVYILSGTAKVWLNGQIQELEAGQWIGFKPKEMVAHTFINDGPETVTMITIGETEDFKGELISYPQNPLRIKECERKSWYWMDFKMKNPGTHAGRPVLPYPEHLRFHLATEDQAELVLSLFEKAPNYFLNVEGCLPDLKMALHAIVDGPEKRTKEYFKEFLLVTFEGNLVGALDLHVNHPEVGITYLGLILIDERFQRKGLGAKIVQLAEDYSKRALDSKVFRLGISEENDLRSFWEKQGFLANGRSYPWKGRSKTSLVYEFDKKIQ